MTDLTIKIIAILIPCIMALGCFVGIIYLWVIEPKKTLKDGLKDWWHFDARTPIKGE